MPVYFCRVVSLLSSGFQAVTKAAEQERQKRRAVTGYSGTWGETESQARHQGRYGKCKSGGIWKSRQVPAPLGMVLFPRLLTCSDNCILRVLDVLALFWLSGCSCWSLLVLQVGQGQCSWPSACVHVPRYVLLGLLGRLAV